MAKTAKGPDKIYVSRHEAAKGIILMASEKDVKEIEQSPDYLGKDEYIRKELIVKGIAEIVKNSKETSVAVFLIGQFIAHIERL